jgi:hypothetical protein
MSSHHLRTALLCTGIIDPSNTYMFIVDAISDIFSVANRLQSIDNTDIPNTKVPVSIAKVVACVIVVVIVLPINTYMTYENE